MYLNYNYFKLFIIFVYKNIFQNKSYIDYKTIQHHIRILEKNNLVTKIGDKYGILYFISNYMEKNIESYYSIKKKLIPR
jgi:predicted transcriptional regulator